MRNIKLVLSYDGTEFKGWQIQPDVRTVQESVENAIDELTGESKTRVHASGRTDTGVHAVGQVAHFHTESQHPVDVFVRGTNAILPDDVVVRSAEEMDLSFDANRHATRKRYRYVIHDGPTPNPFLRRYCCRSRYHLDVDSMRRAASVLTGNHDFQCFETDWPNRASSVRTVLRLSINRIGEWIWLDVEADGFLYNMMRAIAGTLMCVGRGFWPEEHVAEILDAKDRRQAGPTAPPQGLFLMQVWYDE